MVLLLLFQVGSFLESNIQFFTSIGFFYSLCLIVFFSPRLLQFLLQNTKTKIRKIQIYKYKTHTHTHTHTHIYIYDYKMGKKKKFSFHITKNLTYSSLNQVPNLIIHSSKSYTLHGPNQIGLLSK